MSARFVFLVGLSGSGKTVVAESMAERLSWTAYDTDAMIVQQEQQPIDAIFDSRKEPYFRQLEIKAINEIFANTSLAPCVVATGAGLPIIDGMMAQLLEMGTVVFLAASLDELWNRLTIDREGLEKRPLLRRGGRAALERMIDLRSPTYERAHVTVQTDGLQIDDVVAQAVRAISL